MYHTHDHRSPSFFLRSRLVLSLCSLFLVLLLAACSLGGGSTGTASSTTSGNTPAPTHATSVPTQPTSAPAAHMKTFVGAGFTVSYPEGWTAIEKGRGQVMIVNQQAGQAGTFIVGINPAGGKVPAAAVIQFALIGFMALPPEGRYRAKGNHWGRFLGSDCCYWRCTGHWLGSAREL
jgi:hypothetical protein